MICTTSFSGGELHFLSKDADFFSELNVSCLIKMCQHLKYGLTG